MLLVIVDVARLYGDWQYLSFCACGPYVGEEGKGASNEKSQGLYVP
jgi:hypothetical protein